MSRFISGHITLGEYVVDRSIYSSVYYANYTPVALEALKHINE